MTTFKAYGSTKDEIRSTETFQCRQIIKEILDFGVTEFQKLYLINLLTMEIENREQMLKLSGIVTEVLNSEQEEQKDKKVIIT